MYLKCPAAAGQAGGEIGTGVRLLGDTHLSGGWLGSTGTDAKRWSASPQGVTNWGLASLDPSHPVTLSRNWPVRPDESGHYKRARRMFTPGAT